MINRKGTAIPVKGKVFTEANKAARQPILFPNTQKTRTLTLLPVQCLTGLGYSRTTDPQQFSCQPLPAACEGNGSRNAETSSLTALKHTIQ